MCRFFLPSLALTILWHGIATADEQADARAILDKAIAAHGGEAALGKFGAVHFKVTSTGYVGDRTIPLTAECFSQGLDKLRVAFTNDETKTEYLEVVNGKQGWLKRSGGATEAMSEAQVAARREIIYINWIGRLVPLKGAEFHLSPLEQIAVGSRKAIGILVRNDKHDAVRLYFDADSYLTVRIKRRFMNVESGREILAETESSDFKTVQGTKQPFKMVQLWDGTKAFDTTVISVELSDRPFDDKLFAKP
jgi:hypothetical protein